MNPEIEFNLALVLFLPWFAILGALFWFYPRAPRHPMLSWLAMRWGMLNADPAAGAIWKQVLATLLAYGVFLAVVTLAWIARGRIFSPRN